MPDGKALQFDFMMQVKSVITAPSGGRRLRQRGFYEISGIAWSGRGKIRAVEVSVDGGATWRDAQLQEPILSKCLTRFRVPWEWHGQRALLLGHAGEALSLAHRVGQFLATALVEQRLLVE